MVYDLLADIVVLLHLLFIVFVIFGGLLLLFDRRWIWAHMPAVVWAVLIEFAGWICPLTPLEVRLREMGGRGGYRSGFVEHYIIPVLYPRSLDRKLQVILGLLVILVNVAIYLSVLRRQVRIKSGGGKGGVQ